MAELLYKDEVYAIVGAAMDVYNELGATGLRVAVIINFGDPGRLDWKRVVR